jgi:hypothetical protein
MLGILPIKTDTHVPPATDDAHLISRIVAMRDSVRRNKQRALEIWNACALQADTQQAFGQIHRTAG